MDRGRQVPNSTGGHLVMYERRKLAMVSLLTQDMNAWFMKQVPKLDEASPGSVMTEPCDLTAVRLDDACPKHS